MQKEHKEIMDKESKYLLHPQNSPQHKYGLFENNILSDDDDSEDDDDEVAKATLLRREEHFTLNYDPDKGYRGTGTFQLVRCFSPEEKGNFAVFSPSSRRKQSSASHPLPGKCMLIDVLSPL